jgi:hypothetical protein
MPPANRGKRGTKALRKTGVDWAPHSISVRGHGRKFAKAMADRALIDVGVGTSDELPLVISQSFKVDQDSTSTEMEEIECQIMLEQFVASGVVVLIVADIHMLCGAFGLLSTLSLSLS